MTIQKIYRFNLIEYQQKKESYLQNICTRKTSITNSVKVCYIPTYRKFSFSAILQEHSPPFVTSISFWRLVVKVWVLWLILFGIVGRSKMV